MAALTLKSIRLCTLVPGVALVLAPPALAADVSVTLDAGAGFAVKDNTGAIERLRVDEATGNLSRNGALFVHTTGVRSTFVGAAAGNLATTGADNTAVGNASLGSNTTGNRNSAFGSGALYANTTGFGNSAFGELSLVGNTTGIRNSAFGARALRSNSTGSRNAALGEFSLYSNTEGIRNSAFGNDALFSNTTGGANSAVGDLALRANTTGNNNSAFGKSALYSNTTGGENSGFGYEALRSNLTNGKNSAFGLRALEYTTGTGNTAVGRWALRFNVAGSYNAALGMNAGVNHVSGSDNIYLANDGANTESGQIKIGTVGIHTQTAIAGIRGVTTGAANAIAVLIDSNGQLGTVNSSRSVKQEIRDMGDATDRLLELRPVMFRYKQEQTLPSGQVPPPEYGLIAEEVAEVFPDLVVYDEAGQPFTVKYHVLAPMLLNEMQKQQHTIEARRQEHANEIAALTARLARLEGKAASDAESNEATR